MEFTISVGALCWTIFGLGIIPNFIWFSFMERDRLSREKKKDRYIKEKPAVTGVVCAALIWPAVHILFLVFWVVEKISSVSSKILTPYTNWLSSSENEKK